MAYALALDSYATLVSGPVILCVTLIFALLTILVIASVLNPILKSLNVKQKEDRAKSM